MRLTGVSTISKKYQKHNTLTLGRLDQSMAAPILLGILFFFVLCLGAVDSIKGTVMVVAVFTLFIIAVRFKILRDRIYLPFIALTLVVIMDGISTFYAVSGKFALREFLKVFLAYLMAVILLATSPKKEEDKGKRIATILAVCTGIASLVGIDMVSTGWISGAVIWVLNHFTEAYEGLSGVLAFGRMEALFGNANVFAGVAGLGAILSFGVADNEESRGRSCVSMSLSYINMLALMLTISRGAIAVFTLTVLVELLFVERKKRAQWLVQMMVIILLAAITAFLFPRSVSVNTAGVHLAPVLLVLLGIALLCVFAIFFRGRIISMTEKTAKLTIVAVVLIALFAVAYLAVGLSVTVPIKLSKGEEAYRVVRPEPGTYRLEVESTGGPLSVTVEGRSQTDQLEGKNHWLYHGSIDTAEFTVPEDCIYLGFNFIAEEEGAILSASYNDKKIPLDYKLLPSIITTRIQGMFVGRSFLLRTAYFKDGIKLFRRSPVFGLGIGAFENAIKSVQSFYYETKYAHNHYFQTLLETGIIGLILFLLLLVSSAIAIWKSRKEQPFAPMFAALWVFMVGQAIHDIVFSAYAYLPLAYGCFAMIDLCCGDAIKKPKLSKTFQAVAIGVTCAGTVVYCGFLAGNMMAKRNVDREPTMQMLERCVDLDRFEWADYALPYVINAVGDNVNPYIRQQADAFAERLSKVNSNTIPIYLAEYYFTSGRPEQGIAMIEKYVDYVASDQKAWQQAFDLLQAYTDGSELFRDGVTRLANKMEQWNEENIGNVQVNEEAMEFIASNENA